MTPVSPQRRSDIIDALRAGAVPRRGLEALAVGLSHFERSIGDELEAVRAGGTKFKAVRGEYGGGKTFFARWVQERAKHLGFAASEVQISETETPLHRLETVYRRLMERLSTASVETGALRSIVDGWFFTLEEDVLAGGIDPSDTEGLLAETDRLMQSKFSRITDLSPSFAAALRGYRRASAAGDNASADALLTWVAGQPNVSGKSIRDAGLRGDIDHFGALKALQGLLTMLRDGGHAGLVLVLDEVETLQRVRGDVREKALNALRQLLDELPLYPGLYLIITGTPAFFDGPQGVRRLTPLAQRLHTDFGTDPRFDNPRAPQIRLRGFDIDSLVEVGRKVRDIYAAGSSAPTRIASLCDDSYVRTLAVAVSGSLGGKVGVAPRLFLKKLVSDVLDRIDQFPDFDPRRHYQLTFSDSEMTDAERAVSVDDIELPQ
jgi:bacteriophage exclusion system BrxC/D-like protein